MAKVTVAAAAAAAIVLLNRFADPNVVAVVLLRVFDMNFFQQHVSAKRRLVVFVKKNFGQRNVCLPERVKFMLDVLLMIRRVTRDTAVLIIVQNCIWSFRKIFGFSNFLF